MENNKIKRDINNVVNDNLKALEQLFPSAVKDGQLDIKALKEELGDFEEVTTEKYELNWAGKQNAKKIVQQGIGNKTLKFVEKNSKNADTTENIYIEGDNLEVLKLLRQNYYNSIKMIYIDPPYNTGNDFVYNDTFKMDKEESDKAEGMISENNEKLQKNQKSTNRYHANWLNMMYPRLKIARDLLKDDGIICIQIDDNEYDNLLKICNELFGEKNYINTICVNMSNMSGPKVNNAILGKRFPKIKEYILLFAKNRNNYKLKIPKYLKEKWDKEYNLIIPELTKEIKNRIYMEEIDNLNKLFQNFKLQSLSNYMKVNNINKDDLQWKKENLYRICSSKPNTALLDLARNIEFNSQIYFLKNKSEDIKLIRTDYNKETETARIELLFAEDKLESYFGDHWDDIATTGGIAKEGEVPYLNAKKPLKLLKRLLETITFDDKDSIILDFFSGSATTAHAVMQLNNEDNGNRKYIMVQLQEDLKNNLEQAVQDKDKKVIKKSIEFLKEIDKPLLLSEIGKERIRRAGEKIKQEIDEYNSNLKLGEEPKKVPDIGFKVFKVDDTNIKWYDLENFNEESQYSFDDPDSLDFVLGSNDIDIVYEIMLRQNDVPLSERLEVLTDIGNRTYLYASTYLICLETEITEEMIEKLASLEPLPIKFVFRDSAFKDNISLKDETFRKLRSLIERNSGESKVSYRVEFI